MVSTFNWSVYCSYHFHGANANLESEIRTGWKTASSAIPAEPKIVSTHSMCQLNQPLKIIPEPNRRAKVDSFLAPFSDAIAGGDIASGLML
jgi:hypothetical protein